MLSQLKLDVDEMREQARTKRRYYKDNKVEIGRVALAFKDITILRCNVDVNCIDIAITGDYAVLKAIFHAFRTLGYEPSDRPKEEKMSSFSTYFEGPDHECRFWLNFSSTLCKRVKIGTKMVEQPVYETVCE